MASPTGRDEHCGDLRSGLSADHPNRPWPGGVRVAGRRPVPSLPELQAEAIGNAVAADMVIYVGGITPNWKASRTIAPALNCPRCRRTWCTRFTRPASRSSWSIAAVPPLPCRGKPRICPRFFRPLSGRRRGPRRWRGSLRRGEPLRPPASDVLPGHSGHAEFHRLHDDQSHLPLLQRHSFIRVRPRLELHEVRFPERQAGVEKNPGRRRGESDVHGEEFRQTRR